mmetsp:Transcript_13961/g.31938  ORF Transcript_13961/g.31938 Transcript_13961/m.31938 type:complete len:285 (+) Transcript_13961:579-1433(+)
MHRRQDAAASLQRRSAQAGPAPPEEHQDRHGREDHPLLPGLGAGVLRRERRALPEAAGPGELRPHARRQAPDTQPAGGAELLCAAADGGEQADVQRAGGDAEARGADGRAAQRGGLRAARDVPRVLPLVLLRGQQRPLHGGPRARVREARPPRAAPREAVCGHQRQREAQQLVRRHGHRPEPLLPREDGPGARALRHGHRLLGPRPLQAQRGGALLRGHGGQRPPPRRAGGAAGDHLPLPGHGLRGPRGRHHRRRPGPGLQGGEVHGGPEGERFDARGLRRGGP